MRENTRLDKEIREIMTKEFPLPPNVKNAQEEAFARIRRMQTKEGPAEKKRRRGVYLKTFAGLAAAVALFLGICIANPAFAAQVPLVGRVFEAVGDSLGFSGDYKGYAKPLENVAETDGTATKGAKSAAQEKTDLYSQTKNGVTITLSEVYCNDAALYISMVIQSKKEFPETITDTNARPLLHLWNSSLSFDYNSNSLLGYGGSECMDGKFVDAHTYAGVLRYDLSASEDASDYDAYERDRREFMQSLGITQREMEEDPSAASERACQILGVEELTDEAIAEAGGPDWEDYQEVAPVPDSFKMRLSIPMVMGDKVHVTTPQMPKDLKEKYEKSMKAQGLGLTDEDYANFTEEQKEMEHQLFQEMWNQYGLRFPETNQHPNQYENWWVEGPWEFSLDVTKNNDGTIVKEIDDVDENGIGLVSVTKTPFEITIDDGSSNVDTFTVALDADGDILDSGNSGNANILAIQDRDVSRIDVYICDYTEYMDELKGYYWSEDYETKKKEKTFKQLLDERSLYHKELTFD
ncbi:MAG: DUF4179 domain-containing protein [Lachnospiraceae bacterium]|nr:DUF4179 domain-containing protein [Lachnospiraceae bacterium]